MNHKRLLLAGASVVWVLGQAWAQTKTATGSQAKVGPAVHGPMGSGLSGRGSNIHSVNVILRRQMRQIQKDRKSGKVTDAQAKSTWEKLREVRRAELEYFKQNGRKEITPDQKSQLELLLARTTDGNP